MWLAAQGVPPLLISLLWVVIHYVAYDLVFFWGHRAMHTLPRSPCCYLSSFPLISSLLAPIPAATRHQSTRCRSHWLNKAHGLHHSSFADRSVSHHYMSFSDFTLETTLPGKQAVSAAHTCLSRESFPTVFFNSPSQFPHRHRTSAGFWLLRRTGLCPLPRGCLFSWMLLRLRPGLLRPSLTYNLLLSRCRVF